MPAITPPSGPDVATRPARPQRLGLLLHIDGDVSPRQAYREAIEQAQAAEQAGYDTLWLLSRHFHQGREHVSSPLVLLAALARETERIGLGTGVIVLPLLNPIRLAEDAATVDEISGGRLQLGLGSGPFPGAWEAFGQPLEARHEIFLDKAARLREILRGATLNSQGESLHPPGTGVAERLWLATSSDPAVARDHVIATAQAGDGLQLSRANNWGHFQTAEHQAELIRLYREHAAPERARVVVSRAVYPDLSRASALARLLPGARRWQGWLGARPGSRAAEVTPEQYLDEDNARYGTLEEVTSSLDLDPAVREADELMLSFVPATPDHAEHLRLIRDAALIGARHAQPAPRP